MLMICSVAPAVALRPVLWAGLGWSVMKPWLFSVPHLDCSACVHTQWAAWVLWNTGGHCTFVNLRSTSWTGMWAEVTSYNLRVISLERREVLLSNTCLSEFLHHLSSLNTVTAVFTDKLENDQGNAHFNPFLATCLTQWFSWLGIINKMIPILQLCVSSFLDVCSLLM